MTEQEWLTSTDPAAMLRAVGETDGDHPDRTFYRQAPYRASDRKLMLCVEACRLAGKGVSDFVADLYGNGLDVGLRVALEYWTSRDGERQLPLAHRAAILRDIVGNPFRPVTLLLLRKRIAVGPFEIDAGTITEGFSNETYCPWLTPTVLSIATTSYEERQADGTLDPVRLGILADALEEVGCTSEELLQHLRGRERTHAGTYFRSTAHPLIHHYGCWAVDLLLSRT